MGGLTHFVHEWCCLLVFQVTCLVLIPSAPPQFCQSELPLPHLPVLYLHIHGFCSSCVFVTLSWTQYPLRGRSHILSLVYRVPVLHSDTADYFSSLCHITRLVGVSRRYPWGTASPVELGRGGRIPPPLQRGTFSRIPQRGAG